MKNAQINQNKAESIANKNMRSFLGEANNFSMKLALECGWYTQEDAFVETNFPFARNHYFLVMSSTECPLQYRYCIWFDLVHALYLPCVCCISICEYMCLEDIVSLEPPIVFDSKKRFILFCINL